jgi:hypothetical protein
MEIINQILPLPTLCNTVSVFINTTSAPETIAFATRVDFSTVPIVGLQAHWRDIPETIKSDLNSYCATSGTMSVFVINETVGI